MEHNAIETEAATESLAMFTADLAELGRAVDYLARRIVQRRNTVPILSCLHVAADPAGFVTVTGNNLDQRASVRVPASVERPGEFCTDAYALQSVLAKAGKGANKGREATIEDDGARVGLKVGHNRFNLTRQPTGDFPLAPTVDETLSRFTVPAGQFVQDLAALAPCMSSEETKYYLRGVAVQIRELAGRERLVMVATDGKAIGATSRPIPAGADDLADCILPDAAVAALLHAAKFGPIGEAAQIEVGARHATVTLDTATITTQLVDGNFPQWERVFATDGGPVESQVPMFPELLPGVPLPTMEKLAKAAPGTIEWEGAAFGLIGGTAADDGMLFGTWRDPAGGCAKRGFEYHATGNTGEVIGPDGVTYPVAFTDKAIHLSAAQLRDLIGESCFETMAITMPDGTPAHICRWLWDQGDSRFVTVRPDGRCFAGKDAHLTRYVTRAEIEAGPVSESDTPAIPETVAEICENLCAAATEPVERVSEPEAIPVGSEPEIAPSACERPPSDAIEADDPAPDPVSAIMDRLAALEARVDALPAVSAATPIAVVRPKRTPAHERAIRRAWAERQRAREFQAMAYRQRDARNVADDRAKAVERDLRAAERQRDEFESDALRVSDLCRERDRTIKGLQNKRRRAVLNARRRHNDALYWERLYGEVVSQAREAGDVAANRYWQRARLAKSARRMIAAARLAAKFQRQRADVLAAQLDKLKADMADPMQPERASDIARLMADRDQALTAAAASRARAERAEVAAHAVADKLEEMASRVARAEAALRVRAA